MNFVRLDKKSSRTDSHKLLQGTEEWSQEPGGDPSIQYRTVNQEATEGVTLLVGVNEPSDPWR